jgi:hypothetical protein
MVALRRLPKFGRRNLLLSRTARRAPPLGPFFLRGPLCSTYVKFDPFSEGRLQWLSAIASTCLPTKP